MSVPFDQQVVSLGVGRVGDSAIHVELFPAVFEWLTGSKYFEYKKNNVSARLRQGDPELATEAAVSSMFVTGQVPTILPSSTPVNEQVLKLRQEELFLDTRITLLDKKKIVQQKEMEHLDTTILLKQKERELKRLEWAMQDEEDERYAKRRRIDSQEDKGEGGVDSTVAANYTLPEPEVRDPPQEGPPEETTGVSEGKMPPCPHGRGSDGVRVVGGPSCGTPSPTSPIPPHALTYSPIITKRTWVPPMENPREGRGHKRRPLDHTPKFPATGTHEYMLLTNTPLGEFVLFMCRFHKGRAYALESVLNVFSSRYPLSVYRSYTAFARDLKQFRALELTTTVVRVVGYDSIDG